MTENLAAREPTRGVISLRSRLFVVRLWREEAASGPEFRGSVRDVINGAFCHFRAWPDPAAFLVVRVEEAEGMGASEDGRHSGGGGDV